MNNYMIIGGQLYHCDDEICHYGIPGMKWGFRRARRKEAKQQIKADRKKISKRESETAKPEEKGERKGLSDKQKKALKVGAAVVGTALAAYGAKKVYDVVKEKNAIKAAEARERVKEAMRKRDESTNRMYRELAKEMMSGSTSGSLNIGGHEINW